MRCAVFAAWGASSLGLVSCSGAPGGSGPEFGEGGSSPAATSTDSDSDGDDSGNAITGRAPGSSDGGADAGPSTKFDLGIMPDVEPVDPYGCAGIDFLFVVDNSGSMGDDQQRLIGSFDGFISAIEASITQVDSYHVGVVSSDTYTASQPECGALGHLVTQTAGENSSNTVCAPFVDGGRFATESDKLAEKFPCMAQLGTDGSSVERPVSAAIAALDPNLAQPGDCNEGFVRDDAILVVVVVTDDPPYQFDYDDAHLETDTSQWRDRILSSKDGNHNAVIVIGFVPWMDVSCAGLESPNLIDFVQSFGAQGVLASVCEPDYGPVFASAIEMIKTSCDNFVRG